MTSKKNQKKSGGSKAWSTHLSHNCPEAMRLSGAVSDVAGAESIGTGGFRGAFAGATGCQLESSNAVANHASACCATARFSIQPSSGDMRCHCLVYPGSGVHVAVMSEMGAPTGLVEVISHHTCGAFKSRIRVCTPAECA